MTDHGFRARNEFPAVARFAQRIGADDADAVGLQMTQPLAETRQTFDAAIHRRARQRVVRVEPCGESHHLLQPVDDVDAAVVLLRDDEVEAVRSEIERGELSIGFGR